MPLRQWPKLWPTFLTRVHLNDIYSFLIRGKTKFNTANRIKKPPEKLPEGLIVWCARRDSNTRPTDS